MRVLHLPVGRQMVEMCNALQKIGLHATACHFRQRHILQYNDVCLHLEQLNGRQEKKRRQQFLKEAIKKYDVFHFHFGYTFYKDRSDLEFLKQHGKKLIVQHRGSDVRMLSIAQSFGNHYVRVKKGRRREESRIKAKLEQLSEYIDHAIVADHELLSYIKPYYKKIHLLRQFITLDKLTPSYPSSTNTRPLIVHAPTHTGVKGTEFVLKGIERLRKKGLDFDFRIIENLTHEEAIQAYRKSDIIIDQLLQGSFGVFSLEGMALGKPVICFIREDLVNKYPPKLPIINANPNTFYDVLKHLVRSPDKRAAIGLKSRKYIKQHYDSRILVNQLKGIYNQL